MALNDPLRALVENWAAELSLFAKTTFPQSVLISPNIAQPPEKPGPEFDCFMLSLFAQVQKNQKLLPNEANCYAQRANRAFLNWPQHQEKLYDFMCVYYADGFRILDVKPINEKGANTLVWHAEHADGCKIKFHQWKDARDGIMDSALIEWRCATFQVGEGCSVTSASTPQSSYPSMRLEVAFRLNSASFLRFAKEPRRYCSKEV